MEYFVSPTRCIIVSTAEQRLYLDLACFLVVLDR